MNCLAQSDLCLNGWRYFFTPMITFTLIGMEIAYIKVE
jgi:hypothetical protein